MENEGNEQYYNKRFGKVISNCIHKNWFAKYFFKPHFLNIYYSNVRSLVNKLDSLKFLLESNTYQILLFTESWLGHSINDPQLIQNLPYNIIRSDRQSKKGGGVCVFLAKNISFLKIDIPKNKNFDLCAFDIFDSKTISKHRFILVYRPPSLTNFDENLELHDQLSILCSANFSTTIIGDLNLPKINWDTKSSTNINQTEKCFLELSNQLKLTQMITFPTRENNVLDILLTCTPHIITNIQSLPPFSQNDHISDHLSFKFQLCFSQEQQTSLTKLDYKNANYDNINTYLSYIDWNNVFSYSTEIDAQYQSFINILKTAIHLYTPIKKSKSLISKLPKHIQSMIINRDKLFSQYQNNQIIEKINQTSQKIDKEIQRYYRNRENSKMSKLETKYDFVANFLKNRKTNIPTLIDEENNPIFKDNEKAEQIAIFIEKTQTKQNSHYDITLKNPQQKINNIDISELNVFELLSNLSNKINESSDSIPEYFLKKCSATLAYPLYYLFTKSFTSSELPEKWKEAIIVPIPKIVNSSSPNDYRPISLLSPISKIMERIIYVQLVKYIETNNILPDSQHGFRTSKSVTSQLLETFNDLTNSIENKEIVDVIYFDYRKAFDSISHKKLLDKLTNIGITGALHKWITSYLSNRKFKVKIQTSFSNTKSIISGVPQGSILGPLLFILYISDLPEKCKTKGVEIKLFADDLKAYYISKPSPSFSSTLQNFISKLEIYSTQNDLFLSTEKCKVLHIGRQNPKSQYSLYNSLISSIQKEESIRDLGVHFQSDLKWDSHINIIVSKAKKVMFTIIKSLKTNNPHILLNLYKIYIRPIIEFASPIYNP